MSQENVEQLARQVMDALSRRNVERLIEFADPEVEWHSFFAELGDGMTSERAREFVQRMDAAIASRNIEYEAKRESQRLGPPVLKRVAPGTYQALRQRRVAEGAPEAQVKIPQLSTSMEFGKDLTVLEEIRSAAVPT